MNRDEKTAEIQELKSKLEKTSSVVFLGFQGMSVLSVTKLRNEFRKQGVEYRVVKNTLVKKAIAGTPFEKALSQTLRGMTGIAMSYEDPSAAAKVVTNSKKDYEKLVVKGGLIDGKILDGKGVEEVLATMPGKNELRASLLATMQAPLQNFVMLLNAPAQNLAYVLEAKRRKDSGEG